jgi:hypothetical protein
MADKATIFDVLKKHGVPFVVIGAHAVNFHGYVRATEDTDLIWIRSPEAEVAMNAALTEMEARYIGNEIDPATGIEKTYPVDPSYIQISHLMMLETRLGFLDLFDFVPGVPEVDVAQLLAGSIESKGVRYASLPILRQMKLASDREKDRIDLENLGE